jgi:phytoene dehydrogenase-like protein
MSNYDVIVIGGGHNGLVNAAYLARAGKRVLVLERRHVLGGAAVTEEIFPGFKYSVCSYVVSLLRPEIIRELDLPRHGLEILPLDGTFTPMLNGDYLWRVNDHAKDAPRNFTSFKAGRGSLRRIRQGHARDGTFR